MIRLPVSPETCTVNGNRVKATDASWAGLDLANAEPRVQNTLALAVAGQDAAPPDIHLTVPWRHPEDGGDFDCRYRVRPKMEAGKKWRGQKVRSVAFERWDGKWFLAIEFKAGAIVGRKGRA